MFEVGKSYLPYMTEYGAVRVLKRTPKMIMVENENKVIFRMLIRVDENGREFCRDSTVPKRWQDAFTYSEEWEEKAQ